MEAAAEEIVSKKEDDHDSGGPARKRRKGQEYNNNIAQNLNVKDEPCGVLESVTVKNFMCHDHLTFPFTDSINFVQGRNGSGKSAILTAVVVGLGGTTRVTNRGSSLKDLVKYGKHAATIEICIKNSGREAFRHDQYGNLIVVERKILSTGAGGYRLKSKSGVVVSSKKEELKMMLEHFNLQVENPLTVLNQDMSKSFIHSTDPRDLYKFFLKATQLQQVKDDYNKLETSLQISNVIIEDRQSSLPLLEKEVKEMQCRANLLKNLSTNRNTLKELRRELAWAQIIRAEKEAAAESEKLEKYKSGLVKLEEKIETMEKKCAEEKETHKTKDQEFKSLMQKLDSESKKVKSFNTEKMKAKEQHKEFQRKVASATRSTRGFQEQIEVLDKAIEKHSSAALSEWAVRKEQWEAKKTEVEEQMRKLEDEGKTKYTHSTHLQNTVHEKKVEREQLRLEEKGIRSRCNGVEQELKGYQGRQSNQFTIFGQWVPRVLQEIDIAHQAGKFTAKPVGPLGAFIKVHDPQWGNIAEMVIGNRMSSFCVNNRSDEVVLRKILDRVNFGNQARPTVTVSKFRQQVHDVSRFEVKCEQYSSLWSMLNVSNIHVANTLIDQLQVESILLIPTAQEAGAILKDRRTVPPNCKVAYTLNRDMYYPDPNYRLYSGQGQQPARFLQVSVEQKIRDLKADLESRRVELAEVNKNVRGITVEINQLERECDASANSMQTIKAQMSKLRLQMADIMNQEEQPPPKVSELEEELQQQKALLEEAESKLQQVKGEEAFSLKKFSEASSAFEKVQEDQMKILHDIEQMKENLDDLQDKVNGLTSRLDGHKSKLKEAQKKKKALENERTKSQKNLDKELQMANKFLPRIDTRRSVEEVERQYKSLEAKLNKQEALQGDPVEIFEKLKDLKLRYTKIKTELEMHQGLIKRIVQSLIKRREQFSHFRHMLSIMIQTNFRGFLNLRKLHGKLHFDFKEQTLTMSIIKMSNSNNAHAAGHLRHKLAQKRKVGAEQTLAMMSGGERSFATVSFILSLWDVMASPIRILDEFDVFMDIVARKQSMDIMIEAARENTQYIYLTPLDLDCFKSSDIHVFKMPDPR